MPFTHMQNGVAVSGNGWIELVLIEAKDLIAADLRGTSDPYVRVHYGNTKRRTKVSYNLLSKVDTFLGRGCKHIMHLLS